MTDQIPAGLTREEAQAVREWAERSLTMWDPDVPVSKAARVVLAALLPTPSRPTLADMTPQERRDCQWMQADTKQWGRVVIIVPDLSDVRAALLDIWGDVIHEDHASVTPRPDLPRMEWPGDTPTGPGTLAVGTVIESAADPRIAALPVGTILLDRNEEATTKRHGEWVGLGYVPIPSEGTEFGPWTVLHIPKEDDQ